MDSSLTTTGSHWLSASPYAAFCAARDGHLLYANPAFLDRLGWDESVLEDDPTRLCAPGEWSLLCQRLHAPTTDGRNFEQPVVLIDRQGQSLLCELSVLPAKGDQETAAILSSVVALSTEEKLPSLFEASSETAGPPAHDPSTHTLSPYLHVDIEFEEGFSSARILGWDGHVPGLDHAVDTQQTPKLEDLLEDSQWLHLRTELNCQSPGSAAKLVPMDMKLCDAKGLEHWFNVAIENRPERGPKHWSIEGWEITGRHREESCRRLSSHLMSILNVDSEFEDLAPDVMEYLKLQLELQVVAVHYERPTGDAANFEAGDDADLCLELNNLAVGSALLMASRESQLNAQQLLNDLPNSDRYCFTRSGSCWVRDLGELASADPVTDSLVNRDLHSMALVPIVASGRTIGLLGFFDHRCDRFDDDSVQLLEELVYSIGNAIQRENNYRVVRRSEERYRGLFESSRDGIAIRNLEGSLEAANHAYLGLANLTLDSLRAIPRTGYLSLAAPERVGHCYPGALLKDGFTKDHEMILMRPGQDAIPVLGREWVIADESGRPTRAMEILRDISEAKQAESERHRLVTAIDQADEVFVITDASGSIQYVNPAFERVTGYSREQSIGCNPRIQKSGIHDNEFYEQLWATISSGGTWKGRFNNRKRNGDLYQEDATISPITDDSGRIVSYVAVKRDVTELVELETQLLQAQKLESIGRLAAGIAHEINTPSQYVGDNVQFLSESVGGLMEWLGQSIEYLGEQPENERVQALLEEAEDLDFEFLKEEIPSAIEQSQEGLTRISEIVGAMKSFSHPGNDALEPVDIHDAIRGTVTVARNEWKYVADLELDFDMDLGVVPCLVNEFNQVVLNMIVNAKQAIEEKGLEAEAKGSITISTKHIDGFAEIRIQDTGAGISKENLAKVFDQFFTTKAVGRGTGQGLSLSRDIIVGKHGGQLDVQSEVGVGTTFIIRLPLQVGDGTAEAIR
jgi:PAS domain S-box-containing protein